MYTLSITNNNYPFKENVTLHRSMFYRDNGIQMYSLFNNSLHCYYQDYPFWRYLEIGKNNFQEVEAYIFADIFGDGQDVLITSGPTGTQFYDKTLTRIAIIDDVTITKSMVRDASVTFGNFKNNLKLLLIYEGKLMFTFYQISKKNAKPTMTPIPIDANNNGNQHYYIASILNDGFDRIVIQSTDGVNIYDIDGNRQLQLFTKVPCCNDGSKKLYFANITGSQYKDLIYFNSSGLYLHQYNIDYKSYRYLHSNPVFSLRKWWSEKHTNTIHFEDIDYDGRQEMMFTGPQGMNILSFNYFTNQWRSILDHSTLTFNQRYGTIINVVTVTYRPTFFIVIKNKLDIGQLLKSFNKKTNDIVSKKKYYSSPPKVHPVPKIVDFDDEKEVLLLRDHLDYSFVKETTDITSGKVRFTIPLIDLPYLPIKLKITCNEEGNGVLGDGWTLPESFILLDHQSSVFPEDNKYYIMSSNNIQELEWNSSIDRNQNFFKIKDDWNDSTVRLRHDTLYHQWRLEGPKIKQVYGKVTGTTTNRKLSYSKPVIWKKQWPSWRGSGNGTNSIEIPIAWYLSQVTDEFEKSVYFNYTSLPRETTNRDLILNELHVNRIFDDNGNQLVFKYENRPSEEKLFENKNIFHLQRDKRVILKSYILETVNYRQEVHFEYGVSNDRLVLTAIKQKGDDQPAMSFTYTIVAGNKLDAILLPNYVKLSHDYILTHDLVKPSKLEVILHKDYKVHYGLDYIIFSFIQNRDQLVLNIFNEDMTTLCYTTDEQYSKTYSASKLQQYYISPTGNYEIQVGRNYLLILLIESNAYNIHLHHWENGILSRKIEDNKIKSHEFSLAVKEIIKLGSDFIVYTRASEALKLEWDASKDDWVESVLQSWREITIATYHDKIAVHFADKLYIWFRDRSGKWNNKLIISERFLDDTLQSLRRFDLSDRIPLERLTKNAILQFNKNIIMLSKWELNSFHNVTSYYKIYLLDESYSVYKQNVFTEEHGSIPKRKELKLAGDQKAVVGYRPELDGNIRLLVYSINGNITRVEYKHLDYTDTVTDHDRYLLYKYDGWIDTEEDVKEKEDPYREQLNTILHIDYPNFYGVLRAPVVTTHRKRLRFDGNEWHTESKPNKTEKENHQKIYLQDKFLIQYKKKNLYYIYHLQGNRRRSNTPKYILPTATKETIAIKYPYYVASTTGKELILLKFVSDYDEIIENRISCIGNLSKKGSYEGMIIEYELPSNYTRIKYYKMMGTNFYVVNVNRTSLEFGDGMKREVGYSYSNWKVTQGRVQYEDRIVIPGGRDQNETRFIYERMTENGAIRFQYNNDGLPIVIDQEKVSDGRQNETEVVHKESTLYDKTKEFPIAKFFPFEINEGFVDYFGFEDYEVDIKWGILKSAWNCSIDNIQKKKFSFTGENHLLLNPGDNLEKIFYINNNMTFVASTWIRTQSKITSLGSPVSYLMIKVGEENSEKDIGFLSEVKLKSGEWYYLESVVNLHYVNQILGHTTSQHRIAVTVGAVSDKTVDVDHVRFSPLNCLYEAYVYDINKKIIREIIQYNGLVTRFFYDKYNQQTAKISEFGQLTEYNMYTKASISKQFQLPSSDIIVKTDGGFYEDFNPNTLYLNWVMNAPDAFQVSPGHLKHTPNTLDTVYFLPNNIDESSFGIRLYYKLYNPDSQLQINTNIRMKTVNSTAADMQVYGSQFAIPLSGELLVIKERSRLFVWIEGVLCFDKGDIQFQSDDRLQSQMRFDFNDEVRISELMVFNKPSVDVTYFNELGEKVQFIQLEDETRVIVTEYLYDELGRQSITTSPISITRESHQQLLAHYSKLVTNKNPSAQNSVWKLGKLDGEKIGNTQIGRHDYVEFEYHWNPADKIAAVGLPGAKFSKYGDFKKQYNYGYDRNSALLRLYPPANNYTHSTEIVAMSKRGYEVIVDDKNGNRVAWYVHASDKNDSLCTYEYDEENRLVKILPRVYHQRVNTLYRKNQSLTDDERALRELLATAIKYDDNGKVTEKTTADGGRVEQKYDENDLMKSMVYYKYRRENETAQAVEFTYDGVARVTSTSLVAGESAYLGTYQTFHYSDWHTEPGLRGRLYRTITYNTQDEPLIEESLLNGQDDVVMKRIILPMGNEEPLLIDINKKYAGSKVMEIEYPVLVGNQPFILRHEYDRLGRLIGLGLAGYSSFLFTFIYNPAGQLINETHYPSTVAHNFYRHYTYNSPGFLTGIQDQYLTEKVFYTDKDYDGFSYGDGTVTRTEFIASWHKYTSDGDVELNERSFINGRLNSYDSKLCFDKLKKAGYIDEFNHQIKILYRKLPNLLPSPCTAPDVVKILGQKGFPSSYGHIYSYGIHGELLKGKYFVGGELPAQLTIHTLEEKIGRKSSETLWYNLIEGNFTERVEGHYPNMHNCKQSGKPYISQKIKGDLLRVNSSYEPYIKNIENMLIYYYTNRKVPEELEFKKAFLTVNNMTDSESTSKDIREIYKMLISNNYFREPLDKHFKDAITLGNTEIFPEIVAMLLKYFAMKLGQAEFDVGPNVYDVNGNILSSYRYNIEMYELEYEMNSNRFHTLWNTYLTSVNEGGGIRSVIKYDDRGNVVEAQHKDIREIQYHPVLDRVRNVVFRDGSVLFYYDAKGERILKKVINYEGMILKEVHYIRDEFGNTLVERQLTYQSVDEKPDLLVTVYIYGPRGLIGFIRRDEYHSVLTDHENSVRLVVKGGQVVAAYEYLPFGDLMREYARYPESHIRYRYTGQEYDDEFGLYNYHARIYDPSIGRFYQVDPKGTNCSPYVYANNSPVSTVDPTGEDPITMAIVCIIFFLVGAYFGGAAANKSFNPFAWDWSNAATWLGIFAGGIAGATLPVGFLNSVAALAAVGVPGIFANLIPVALGVITSYISIAATFDDWNPLNWDWTSPELWFAFINGFSVGSGAIGSFQSVQTFFGKLTEQGKFVFVGSSVLLGVGAVMIAGSTNNWDFSNPALWFGIVKGVLGATKLPMALKSAAKFFSKNFKIISSSLSSVKSTVKEAIRPFSLTVLSQLKPSLVPLIESSVKILTVVGITAASVYYHGEVSGNWNFSSPGFYKAILDGVLAGLQLSLLTSKALLKNYDKYKSAVKAYEKKMYGPRNDWMKERDSLWQKNVEMQDKSVIDAFKDITKNKPILEFSYKFAMKNKKTSEIKDLHLIAQPGVEDEGQLNTNRSFVAISDDSVYSAFTTDNGGVAIAFSEVDKHYSPVYVNTKKPGSLESRIDNNGLMEGLLETYEAVRDDCKKNLTALLTDIRGHLNKVEMFDTIIKNDLLRLIKRNIDCNGYLKGGQIFIAQNIAEARYKIASSNESNLYFRMDEQRENLRGKIVKQLDVKEKELDIVLGEINDINKEIGRETGELNAKIDLMEKQAELATTEIYRSISMAEKYFTVWPTSSNLGCDVFNEYLITSQSHSSFIDELVDLRFMRASQVREYLERFEIDNAFGIRSAKAITLLDDLQKYTIGGPRSHFLAPYDRIINHTNGRRHRRSININEMYGQQLISDNDVRTSPVIPKRSYFSGLSDWLKRMVINEDDQDGANTDYEGYSQSQTTNISDLDVHSTLSLAKVLIAKLSNRKLYAPQSNDNISYIDALSNALKITQQFEEEIVHVALEVGLPMSTLSIDFVQVQNDVLQRVMGNKYHEIFPLLHSYTVRAYPADQLDTTLLLLRDNFIAQMAKLLQIMVYTSLSQLFERGTKKMRGTNGNMGGQQADGYYSSTKRLLSSNPSPASPDIKNVN